MLPVLHFSAQQQLLGRFRSGAWLTAVSVGLACVVVTFSLVLVVQFCKGFPTGGVVMGTGGARLMHSTGRGSITIRATAHVEPPARKGGREAVVVTELPYGVAKNNLLEKIATMVNEKKLDGVAEIRDESSLEGMRIVFEVKRDAEPLVVLNNMYTRTEALLLAPKPQPHTRI